MTPKSPNRRNPNPVETLAQLRADLDELLARGAPAPSAMFVREVALPIVVDIGGET